MDRICSEEIKKILLSFYLFVRVCSEEIKKILQRLYSCSKYKRNKIFGEIMAERFDRMQPEKIKRPITLSRS